jgi:hypothetical protein
MFSTEQTLLFLLAGFRTLISNGTGKQSKIPEDM